MVVAGEGNQSSNEIPSDDISSKQAAYIFKLHRSRDDNEKYNEIAAAKPPTHQNTWETRGLYFTANKYRANLSICYVRGMMLIQI